MMSHKVELLAPAGSYQAFIGAMNAGADAVYLAGKQFGARAYADNFSCDELIQALDYAHLFGKKIYLTLNTLVKDSEIDQIYDYILPFYEHGLDGVIVQDLGVLKYLKEHFPLLELHASTQMTITGANGANYLKQFGVTRVVPARELSLTEIKDMKEECGLEIETFIHGAICYCYSGQCLFSSLIGGRSGNRGRCAQPCRLSYEYDGMNQHYLSLKDMCTIEMIPQLINAGIDSFKIEGRMKRPEYAAGVTAIYRKYIDQYYENPDKPFRIDAKDMDILNQLYIRKERSLGYYEKHNGKDMITLDNPAYSEVSQALLDQIGEQYLTKLKQLPVTAYLYMSVGMPLSLTIVHEESGVSVTVEGNVVDEAKNQPLSEENVIKQLTKTGNTEFYLKQIDIQMEGNCFCPVKVLNELRRNAFDKLKEAMLLPYMRTAVKPEYDNAKLIYNTSKPHTHVLVSTMEQLDTVLNQYSCERIYVEDYLFNDKEIDIVLHRGNEVHIYIALPYILRQKRKNQYKTVLKELLNRYPIHGILVRNLEEVELLNELQCELPVIADHTIYTFNKSAVHAVCENVADEYTLPVELNFKELMGVASDKAEMLVYGRIPVMFTANCILKTRNKCSHSNEVISITDRYHKKLPVRMNCRECYNVIYNSVVYSLHKKSEDVSRIPVFANRVAFTFEDSKEVKEIMDYYMGISTQLDLIEYTNGHFNRGVE
ncbi:MAG: U32 family peptidase [Lachnospiraceae bacterium]|nr:U32 family peptidase [Lachnospiraceae bacterium]